MGVGATHPCQNLLVPLLGGILVHEIAKSMGKNLGWPNQHLRAHRGLISLAVVLKCSLAKGAHLILV